MKTKAVMGLTIALGIGFAITIVFVAITKHGSVFGVFEGDKSARDLLGMFGAGLYAFSITLVGVALGAVYRRLIQLKKDGVTRIQYLELIVHVATSVDFCIGLVAAPVVFGMLWQSMVETTLPGLTIIALQNGFAANAIVAQLAAGKVETLQA